MGIEQLEFVVAADQTGRLDQVVRQLIKRSWSDARGMIYRQCVSVDGEICTDGSRQVAAGTQIKIRHDPGSRYHKPPEEHGSPAYELVLEDEHLMVVNKAAAVLTVPTDHHETNTLVGALNRHLARHREQAHVVHRLDRGTSGLLVFGKNAQIARELQNQFRERKPLREYAAIVAGKLDLAAGTFSTRLGTLKNLQRYSVEDDEPGEDAITHYRVEQRLRDTTYVTATLETGKRNQIRVHFSETGHPVLGDQRYRPDLADHPGWKPKRLALHAVSLEFQHPRTQEVLRLRAGIPPEFLKFLRLESPK